MTKPFLLKILNVSINAIENGDTSHVHYELIESNMGYAYTLIDWDNLPIQGEDQFYDVYIKAKTILENKQ